MTVTRDFEGAGRRDVYRVLSSLVVPRPIAWVATLNGQGRVNLAPFSSFMGIFNPPALAIDFGRKSDGSLKDTHRNLRERRDAVVHIPDEPRLEAMHASAAELPETESELERLGLETTPSLKVAPPRLAQAAVALECRYRQEVAMGPDSDLVILDVLAAHAADGIWNPEIDCADGGWWGPVARLGSVGGPNYAFLGARRTLPKPRLP